MSKPCRAVVLVLATALAPLAGEASAGIRAGASAVDVSPTKLPAIVNGGFLQASADRVNDPLFARALVLDDGRTRIAIVVVDSCMMPRELLDRAKSLARTATGISTDHMLISATHTHSAPAAMGALGCSVDASYAESLPERIAESIVRADERLAPARVGFASVDDPEHTHCRRWIRRPDRLLEDPFGAASARANMHPGHESPDVIGPAGPVDPGLSVLAVQTAEGRPLAVLANYSMHYFGAPAVSADYFGRFAARLGERIGGDGAFVAMMSQGTSGDQQWMDYGQGRPSTTLDAYADAVAAAAERAYRSIEFRDDAPVAMAEATVKLSRREPDEDRLAWARPIAAAMGDRPPKDLREVYAREAIFLHDEPERELKLQAIRIGEVGIAAIPDEVYALTGLKIKAWSPLRSTFTIELANGSEGYIPPPEQHALGGYTTWPARTAALEVEAEPKIVETVLGLLERVSGKARRAEVEPPSTAAAAVLASKPVAFWRLDEMDGTRAIDASGRGLDASREGGVALFLDGPTASNHCVHLAGGFLKAPPLPIGPAFTVELWFWNGLPNGARAIAGDLVVLGERGPRLSLAGPAGRLVLRRSGEAKPLAEGPTLIPIKKWHHLALVADERSLSVYLDGAPRPELSVARGVVELDPAGPLFLGGDPDREATWEGKLDEVAVFDCALAVEEIAAHVGRVD